MSNYECPSCGGGFPEIPPEKQCPWCGESMNGKQSVPGVPSTFDPSQSVVPTIDEEDMEERECVECGDEFAALDTEIQIGQAKKCLECRDVPERREVR